MITIALSRGRIFDDPPPLLRAAGVTVSEDPETSRNLILGSTGNTRRANHLVAVEEVAQVSAALVINQAALKFKHRSIQPLLDAFARAAA